MELIIDIPKNAYDLLQGEGVDWLGAEHIIDAVAKGKPVEKCDYCVSLNAVIDVFDTWWAHNHESDNAIEILEDKLNALLPATPFEKVGHWLNDGLHGDCRCSVCKHEFDCDIANMRGFDFALPKFCPNCGAKMVEVEK